MPDQSQGPPALRPAEARISRRSMLRGAGVLGVGVGFGLTPLLTACGVADDGAGKSGGGSGKGGTLTLAIDSTSAVNDPAFYTTLGDWMAVDCVCRGLTFISFESNEPAPDLAKSWKVSDDQLTYTFALREGVKFHDGTTLSSADVLATLDRQFDPENKTLPKGASRPLASLGANVASLTAEDDLTVKLVLKTPDRTVLAQLSDIGGRIISKAALDTYGADIGKHLVGTGPFQFSSATSGQSITLKAFDGFRLGRPPIDRLVLRQVQDPSAIVSSLLSGDVSATQFTPYSAVEQLKSDPSLTVHDTREGFDAILMIDARRVPELKVRKAINLAIDRKAIVRQAFFGVGSEPEGYAIPPAQNGYDTGLADLSTKNLAQARKLLKEAGAEGRELGLMAASDTWHPKAAQIVKQNLEDAGFKVRTTSVDPASYFSRLSDGADDYHDLMIWERNSYVPDPNNMVGSMANPAGLYGATITGLDTLDGAATMAEELVAAKNLPDGKKRTAAYSRIQRRWAEEYMVIAMLACSTNLVVSGSGVKGINAAALGNHRCFMEKASV
ncbi:ABC transporter substrate-binding protein [Streptomyces scopuliridis]|uniref:ABC transporter substrate-binding protein n=1 Tax=Streptomyces scopuliridis TaxID=452529 RepID=UPI002DDB8DA9|nr:ABC transporter substrate-binding protein [Streptomyces scopuliridis]WSB31476.1 ABC transporter substrate-binding protein [Streptomyces scopuliridis]